MTVSTPRGHRVPYSEAFGIASTEGGLFDVERIEVLRGPQGTLYGRNGIGAAVNFINALPTEEFEGEARVIAGSYDKGPAKDAGNYGDDNYALSLRLSVRRHRLPRHRGQ